MSLSCNNSSDSSGKLLLDLDTGAVESMLSARSAERGGLDVYCSERTTSIYGIGGDSTAPITTNMRSRISSMPVLVAEGLAADLVSANPLVDSGCTIALGKRGGTICHEATGKCIPVRRNDMRW